MKTLLQKVVIFFLSAFNIAFTMSVNGQPDSISENSSDSTCSYTFHVLRSNGQCQPGGQHEARAPFELRYLEAIVTNQHALLEQHLNLISEQLNGLKANTNTARANDEDSGRNEGVNIGSNFGTVFTRWGKTTCPETAEWVYKGFAAKSYFTHGGGVNYQCLPTEPEFPTGATAGAQSQSYIYGVECATTLPLWTSGTMTMTYLALSATFKVEVVFLSFQPR